MHTLQPMRSILDGTLNTRDLGGYAIQGTEEVTVTDRIYRSDRCDQLCSRDKEVLLKNRITTIIDVRSEAEVEKKPSAFATDVDFSFFLYPIREGMLPPPRPEEVPLSYMRIAQAHPMRDIFATIAEAPEGVLYHCTAGKDRTGVISAVLLSLAGVSDADVAEDYALSRYFNKTRLEVFLREHPEVDPDVVLAREKTIHFFLKLIREEYVTIAGYLLSLGLTEAQIQKLKEKLSGKRA